jgi:hypothetical protein
VNFDAPCAVTELMRSSGGCDKAENTKMSELMIDFLLSYCILAGKNGIPTK